MHYIEQDRLVGQSENGGSLSQTDAGETLVPIDLDFVPLNVQLNFPIFHCIGEGGGRKFTLLRNSGTALSTRVRDQLRRGKVLLYTKEKYLKAYEESVNNRMETILTDESVSLEKRVAVLQAKGEMIMKDFLARPDSKENYEETQELVRNIVQLSLSNQQTAETMIRMARRDYHTYTHSLQVCILGVGFAQNLFSDREMMEKYSFNDDLEKVGRGFIYHDVGKSLIDSKVLRKVGPLSPAEWDAIRKHPLDGAHLLKELGIRDRDILHITLYHHERMNGTGYPHGLNGFEIPAIARVAAITDAFDAITSSRPYKRAVGTFRALTTMRDENVGFYDAELFQYFVRMFGRDSNPSGPETTEQNG